jgi:glutamate N-acetyltransferase/amino-acid N-acetyltransferase
MKIEQRYILPPGFRSAGVHAGIKSDATRRDMTLVVSDSPAAAAGVFTRNRVKAAPVKLDMERISSGVGRAIIANSGNANACTGEPGLLDARRMAALTAQATGLDEADIYVFSTGSIGVPLPMAAITSGIEMLAAQLSPNDLHAPVGILTSDTFEKTATTTVLIDGQSVRLSAMAKGAGMIEPNMATMLCFLMTDAAVESPALQAALNTATGSSFNRISIDGDMSTNDSVMVLANGRAGNATLNPAHPDWPVFLEALKALTLHLALRIVADGEGTSKIITLHVEGACNDSDADLSARAIANSLLVKTAWAGDYPVWSRIMDVLGYAGPEIDEAKINIFIDDLPIAQGGLHAGTSREEVLAVTRESSYNIRVDLGLGSGKAVLYTADCTEEYVRLNMF